jgi:hypothetical protein
MACIVLKSSTYVGSSAIPHPIHQSDALDAIGSSETKNLSTFALARANTYTMREYPNHFYLPDDQPCDTKTLLYATTSH